MADKDKDNAPFITHVDIPEPSLMRKLRKLLLDLVIGKRSVKEWIMLLVDSHTLRILSSAVSMFEVVERGVALVESVENETRDALPELPATYFLSPCDASVAALIKDFSSSPPKYSSANVFWSHSVPDELMAQIAKSPAAPFIHAFKEINVEFIAFESQVYHLDSPEGLRITFFDEFNDIRPSYTAEMAAKLVTVLETLDARPSTIRYSLPATQLAATMKNLCEPLETDGMRTTLFLLDRSVDWAAPLLHEFTYQAMINDVLEIQLNDGVFKQEYASQGGSSTRIGIIDERDAIFQQIKHLHVAEAINWLVANRAKFVASDSTTASPKPADIAEIAAKLKSESKHRDILTKYSMHVDISQLAMQQFNQRQLKPLGLFEQDVATGKDVEGGSVNLKDTIKELNTYLESTSSLNLMDITRLLMLLALHKDVKDTALTALIQQAGVSGSLEKAVLNIRKIVLQSKYSKEPRAMEFLQKLAQNFLGKKKSEFQYEVSRYTPVLRTLLDVHLLTNLQIEKLSEEEYPRHAIPQSRTAGTHKKPAWAQADSNAVTAKQLYNSRVVLFFIGGVTFSEIRVAYEWMRANPKVEVVIGGTELIDATNFSRQLSL